MVVRHMCYEREIGKMGREKGAQHRKTGGGGVNK